MDVPSGVDGMNGTRGASGANGKNVTNIPNGLNEPKDQVFDKDSPFTLYYQLREKIAKKISDYEWKPGEKIPSEAELCSMYYVSRITVRKAIEDLVRAGRLVKQQGKGTFVTNASVDYKLSKFYSFSEELKQRGITERVQVLSFDVCPATAEISEKLSLRKNAKVFMIKRLRMADEMPYTVEISYIPYSLCPDLTAEGIADNGLYNSMRALGVFPERIVEKLRATAISKSDAGFLKQKANSPAIQLERLTYNASNTIEYCVSIVRGDFFTYTVELKS